MTDIEMEYSLIPPESLREEWLHAVFGYQYEDSNIKVGLSRIIRDAITWAAPFIAEEAIRLAAKTEQTSSQIQWGHLTISGFPKFTTSKND